MGQAFARSVQFFLEMKQSNFDISNWRSGFQGDGKNLDYASIGSLSSQALVSFEEPWLFEQRVAFEQAYIILSQSIIVLIMMRRDQALKFI